MEATEEIFKNIIENLVPLHTFLKFKLENISEGFALIKVPFKEQYVGDPRRQSIHGGIIATALDSVGGAAAMTTLISFEDVISTIDMRVDYLRPGKPEDLFVEGRLVRSGNRIVVTSMIAFQGNKDYVVAEAKGVYNVKRKTDI